jgi:hypothetical protein
LNFVEVYLYHCCIDDFDNFDYRIFDMFDFGNFDYHNLGFDNFDFRIFGNFDFDNFDFGFDMNFGIFDFDIVD